MDHAHECVVNRAVAVGMIRTHDFAHDLRTFGERAVGTQTLVEHRVQDSSVHWLQTVAHVGQRTRDDHRHRVLEERSLHLQVDLDGFDVADDSVFGRRRTCAGVVGCACHMPLLLDV